MDRILQGNQATVTTTFTVDGVPTDPTPADATVTITGMAGEPILTDAPTTRSDVGTFAIDLAPEQVDELGTLTVEWTSSLGTIRTLVEVVGGFLFRLDELRAQEKKLEDVGRYPADVLADTRTLVEDAIEHACDVAFVPRGHAEMATGDGSDWLMLSRNHVRAIRSATVAGTTWDITGVVFSGSPMVYNPLGWPWGVQNISVVYEHGYNEPPPRVRRAALILARVWLLRGPIDDRATQVSTAAGGVVNLATPGVFGSTFGVPEVDAVVREYAYPQPAIV